MPVVAYRTWNGDIPRVTVSPIRYSYFVITSDVVIDAAALEVVGEGRRQRRRQQKEHANAQSIKLSHNRFFYVCNFYLSCRSRRDAKVCVSANRLRLPSQT